MCVWRNVSEPGEFFRWKVKRWESLSWRQHKVAPNRADRLTSTHPQNHKELGLYLLTAAAGGRVCAFGHMYKDLYCVLSHLLQQSKRSNGEIKTSLLHNASWEKKHTPAPTLAWSLPLPVPFCKRAIICLQSCAFQTELFRMNPLSLPVCRIPELSSSVWLRVRATWETEAGIVQASVCTTMTSRKRPNGYFKLFWYLFRTSQAVCGRKVWNREKLCSGNVKKRSQNVKKKKKSGGTFFHNRGMWTTCVLWYFSSVVGRVPVGLSHSVSQEKSGKRASPYRHGESVVIAFLLWPCWLADSLTWDHSGQLTSISLCCALPARCTSTRASPLYNSR